MGLSFILTLFLIGFVGSFISGMLGIGGAIINYPILLYVPAVLGFTAFSAHEVSGIVAVQVFFATLGGVWYYRKSEYMNRSLVLYMGISILAGSLIGGFGSKLISEGQVNVIYAVLATAAAVMMLIPKKGVEHLPPEEVKYNGGIAAGAAFLVGTVSGIVGAGGAFILVPIMLVILKIPTRMTIASSLAITFISSIGSIAGKVATGQVVWLPAAIMVVASLIASPLGAKAGQRMNTKVLQLILAGLIVATSIKIWLDILG
ncbi:sulfite exporter TauE/SafE family protein [Ectobacillus ponti]|uniref:Probable membrane transporter protein n=1 Tax=Ectobacillus ponti TaxID=2961894 RepID=A0AA41X7F0_9BACI|nr:sulfite exporter TauE/SafE family protein [Ectobacillus ponti]MCP8970202.1 sulfite exporter TauE/SafE family protein [Ectobacillus ponti]